MPDNVIESMAQDIQRLKRELEVLKSARPMYPVWSYAVVTPGASQNNYDVGDYTMIYVASTALLDITGIAGGVPGRIIVFRQSSGFTTTFKHASGSSSVQNRMNMAGSADVSLSGGKVLAFIYYDAAVGWLELFKDT